MAGLTGNELQTRTRRKSASCANGALRCAPAMARAARLLVLAVLCIGAARSAFAQSAGELPNPRVRDEQLPPPPGLPTSSEIVSDVRVAGNQSLPLQRINPLIRTRAGRPLAMDLLEEDVRRLNQSKLFVDVQTSIERTPQGAVVIFKVVERPRLREVKFVGNNSFFGFGMRHKTLAKKSGLKAGDPLDPYAVEEARRKVEEFYHEKGYQKATVVTIEGNKPKDRKAVFLINEGEKQRVGSVKFDGNSKIVSDGRLKTQIQSKPPILWLFKGEVSREKIEDDKDRIIAYYRSLGFFEATVGADLDFDEKNEWLDLRFVINEGPRYKIRNVALAGATKFEETKLREEVLIKPGEYFVQATVDGDAAAIQDVYGTNGYIFAAVQPDVRFLTDPPGHVDLIYSIEEGGLYRIGRVEVNIAGDDQHTRRNTVLNRSSLHPGDIASTQELRATERRLKAAQIFKNDPTQGVAPSVAFKRPTLEEFENIANQPSPSTVRGQSPDGAPGFTPAKIFRGQSPVGYSSAYGPQADKYSYSQAGQTPGASAGYSPYAGQTMATAQAPERRYAASPQTAATAQQYSNGGAATTQLEPIQRTQYTQPSGAAQYYGSQSGAPQYSTTPQYSNAPQYSSTPQYGAAQQYNAAQGSPGQFTSGQFAGQQIPTPQYPAAGQSEPWYQRLNPFSSAGETTGAPVPGAQTAMADVPQYGYDNPAQIFDPAAVGYPNEPILVTDPVINVQETQTGRFMVGFGVNSDLGVVGNITLDEQNFDILNYPTSWGDIRDATAWRGRGQQFRIEASPGTEVQRYVINFKDPYIFDSLWSFGTSAYFFDRIYRDWDEQRIGGTISLGRQLTQDLSATVRFRGEEVTLSDPAIPTPADLAAALGSNGLYGFRFGLVHDTRDSSFLPTQGHYFDVGFEQVIGTYEYPRLTAELRQYFLLKQRADSSGRHVLGVGGEIGFTGDDTPIYDRFYGGGSQSLRGFRFRGASPRDLGVEIGGEFSWINSIEYLFPITGDDMLRGVVFVDFGTVEREIDLQSENFRVSPGMGIRLMVPALAAAPIALDISSPVSRADGDRIQNVAFTVGLTR